jgi:hypothetical protein
MAQLREQIPARSARVNLSALLEVRVPREGISALPEAHVPREGISALPEVRVLREGTSAETAPPPEKKEAALSKETKERARLSQDATNPPERALSKRTKPKPSQPKMSASRRIRKASTCARKRPKRKMWM